MAVPKQDPNILNLDPISGANNIIDVQETDAPSFSHIVYPYRFRARNILQFGKANSTLIISITNSEVDIPEHYSRMKLDNTGQPYFEIKTHENIMDTIQANTKLSSYSVNIIAKSQFVFSSSDFFTPHQLTLDTSGVVQLDGNYMWCYTIDVPFDPLKFNNDLQSVYLIQEGTLSSNLEPDQMLEVIKYQDEIIDNKFNWGAQFVNSYDFASQLNMTKISFTLVDLQGLNMAQQTTTKFSEFENPNEAKARMDTASYQNYLRHLLSVIVDIFTPPTGRTLPSSIPLNGDTQTGYTEKGWMVQLKEFTSQDTHGIDKFTNWVVDSTIAAAALTPGSYFDFDPSSKFMVVIGITKGWSSNKPQIEIFSSSPTYNYPDNKIGWVIDTNAWNGGLAPRGIVSDFRALLPQISLSALEDPNFITAVWTEHLLDDISIVEYQTVVPPINLTDIGPAFWADPTSLKIITSLKYVYDTTFLQVNSDALINLVTVEGERTYNGELVQNLEYDVFSNHVPLKGYPIQIDDQLTMKFDWLDWAINLPIYFATELPRAQMSASPSITLFHFFYRWNTTTAVWDELYPGLSGYALAVIADMICMSKLITDGFKEVATIKSTTNVTNGQLDPNTVIGYNAYTVGTLNMGATSKLDIVDKIYNDFILTYNIKPTDEIYIRLNCVIAMLSRYLSSSMAISQGNNIFNEIFQSFYINLTDDVQVTSTNVTTPNPVTVTRYIWYPVFNESIDQTATIPAIPTGSVAHSVIADAQLDILSNYYLVNGSVNEATTGTFNLSVVPYTNHNGIGKLKFVNVGRKLMFPLMPDTMAELDMSIQPGDIDTTNNSSLSYLLWTDLQGSQVAFNKMFMLAGGTEEDTTTPVTFNLSDFQFIRTGTGLGQYPQSTDEQDNAILQYVKQVFRVKDISNVTITNRGQVNIVTSTIPADTIKYRIPRNSNLGEISRTIPTTSDDFWHYTQDGLYWLNKFVYYQNSPGTFDKNNNVLAANVNQNINSFSDLVAYFGSLHVSNGDTYYHLSEDEMALYATSLLSFDWNNTANSRMLIVEKYDGKNVLPDDNPRVYLNIVVPGTPDVPPAQRTYELSAVAGEAQFNVTPKRSFISGAIITITGEFFAPGITNIQSEFTKNDWINYYTKYMQLPITQSEFTIRPTNSFSELASLEKVENRLQLIYLRGAFIREASLLVSQITKATPTSPYDIITQEIPLPIPKDLDDSTAIFRFIFF